MENERVRASKRAYAKWVFNSYAKISTKSINHIKDALTIEKKENRFYDLI